MYLLWRLDFQKGIRPAFSGHKLSWYEITLLRGAALNIYLEIFGYVGTALVLLSFMMTSVIKLRIFNIVGSFVSMAYAFLCGAWPVVFLNLGLVAINVWQLIRLQRTKTVFDCVNVNSNDKSLEYFLAYHANDIAQYFPNYKLNSRSDTEVYMVYTAGESVGVLIGSRDNELLHVELDYSTAKYRDCSVGTFLYDQLKKNGIKKLVSESQGELHNQYMTKMGFVGQKGKFCKTL